MRNLAPTAAAEQAAISRCTESAVAEPSIEDCTRRASEQDQYWQSGCFGFALDVHTVDDGLSRQKAKKARDLLAESISSKNLLERRRSCVAGTGFRAVPQHIALIANI